MPCVRPTLATRLNDQHLVKMQSSRFVLVVPQWSLLQERAVKQSGQASLERESQMASQIDCLGWSGQLIPFLEDRLACKPNVLCRRLNGSRLS